MSVRLTKKPFQAVFIAAALLTAGWLLSGCASMKPSIDEVAKDKAQRESAADAPRFRPRGKSDLPFWYSSKSHDIEESLGGSRP